MILIFVLLTNLSFADDKRDNNLLKAVKNNDLDTAKALIQQGANVNAVFGNDNYLIHQAVMLSNIKTIEFLIEKGANINSLNSKDETALDLAVKTNNKKLIAILKEKGGQTRQENRIDELFKDKERYPVPAAPDISGVLSDK